MSALQRVPQWLYLTLANLLIPVAVVVFATGFFPYKPFMPGLATFEESNVPGIKEQPVPAIFDKVVFMVVDALRSDFVFGEESGMEYVQRYSGPLETFSDSTLTIEQSHTLWRRLALHSPRILPNYNHAPRQSPDHRLHSLLPRRNPQLRRVRHILDPRSTGHLARADARQRRRQARHVRRRYVAEAVSWVLREGGWDE